MMAGTASDPAAPIRDAAAEIARLRRRLRTERLAWAGLLLIMLMVWAAPVLFPSAWAIYVDGKPVATVESSAVAHDLVKQVRETKLRLAGAEAAGAGLAQEVSVRRVPASQVRLLDSRAALKKLGGAVELQAERGVIYIDGISVVALPSAAEAREMLEKVRQRLSGPVKDFTSPPAFRQKVEVRQEPARQEIWADRQTAEALLLGDAGAAVVDSVVVRRGDTAGAIAARLGISLSQLERLNPGADWTRLRIGQKLRTGEAAEPIITVEAAGRLTELVTTPFQVRRRTSPSMYRGKTMVIQKGRPGRRRITYEVTVENGRVVGRRPLESRVLASGRPMVMIVGARKRP